MGPERCWISNIRDYQRVHTLNSVLTRDFLLLLLYLGCITKQSSITFICPSAAGSEALGSSAMFYGTNIAEEVVGEGVTK
jgi:hypothetical protein